MNLPCLNNWLNWSRSDFEQGHSENNILDLLRNKFNLWVTKLKHYEVLRCVLANCFKVDKSLTGVKAQTTIIRMTDNPAVLEFSLKLHVCCCFSLWNREHDLFRLGVCPVLRI